MYYPWFHRCCGAVNQAPISNAPKAIGSTLGSFTVNIWYPQCCIPVETSTLNTILQGIQKVCVSKNRSIPSPCSLTDTKLVELWMYPWSLFKWRDANSTLLQDCTSLFVWWVKWMGLTTHVFAKLPSFLKSGKGQSTTSDFIPTIVIEFLFTTQLNPTDVSEVESHIIELVQKNIVAKNCTQEIR